MAAAAADPRIRAVVSVLGPMDGAQMLRDARREHEYVNLLGELEADRVRRVLTGQGESTPDLAPPTPERSRTTALSQAAIPPIPLACVEAIAEFRPIDVVSRISPRAAMWIAATLDPTCPVEHSRLGLRRCRLTASPGGDRQRGALRHVRPAHGRDPGRDRRLVHHPPGAASGSTSSRRDCTRQGRASSPPAARSRTLRPAGSTSAPCGTGCVATRVSSCPTSSWSSTMSSGRGPSRSDRRSGSRSPTPCRPPSTTPPSTVSSSRMARSRPRRPPTCCTS